jgi:hypothetical protein
MLTEASTPLLNFRNQMKRIGYRGVWYIVNGFAFGISFGITRIGGLGYGLFQVLKTRHVPPLPHNPKLHNLFSHVPNI